MAREILAETTYDGKMADIYACGVILYSMLLGEFPSTFSNIKQAIAAKTDLSNDAKDLIVTMLAREPA